MFRVSRFSELLKHLPRGLFARSVERHQADKHRKGFSSWQQLVAMIYAQLSGATSLRTLEGSLNAHRAHHYHLGLSQPLRRSTLADANAKATLQVYSELAHSLMQQAQRRLRVEGQQVLRLLDSTSLSLKGAGFDQWTQDNRTRYTQGLKLHVLFGAAEQAPLAQAITAPNVNDIEYARTLSIEPQHVYVFDKAYCHYRWWWHIQQSGARFVTRLKRNVRVQVLQERAISRAARGVVLKDQRVYLASNKRGTPRPNPFREHPLRRIEVAREGKPPLILITNDLRSSALRIAEHYRTRWQIELFFKWIKQHLRIKRFFGRSERAVRLQILTALIAYLLVALHAKAQGVSTTLWLYLAELRSTLFQRSQSDWRRHRLWRERRCLFQLHQRSLFA